jgi:Restriction endonuclease
MDVVVGYAKKHFGAVAVRGDLEEIGLSFAKKTNCERFLSPGWVDDHGVAHVVFISHDTKSIREVNEEGKFGVLSWRWNEAPTTFLSLTVVINGAKQRPYIRWLASDDDPIVAAIRRNGAASAVIVNTVGRATEWFDIAFSNSPTSHVPRLDAFDELWKIPARGIPLTNQHSLIDVERQEPYNDDCSNEIPLWKSYEADFWKLMRYKGPWQDDKSPEDFGICAWAKAHYRHRSQFALHIELLKESMVAGTMDAVFDEVGMCQMECSSKDRINNVVRDRPAVGKWLASIAGKNPDAKQAHEACLELLGNDIDCRALVEICYQSIATDTPVDLESLIEFCFFSAITDPSVTECGRKRPWLENLSDGGFALRKMPLDLSQKTESILAIWEMQMSLPQMMDLGFVLTGHDIPVDTKQLTAAFEKVTLEGTAEEAEMEISNLLHEAQAARQWSVPWGARIELHFGLFKSVRIYEIRGEFFCMFLDEHDRYYHVALGLSGASPVCRPMLPLYKRGAADDSLDDNDDAMTSLRLIAAAAVRDFLVVEDRTSVFETRPFKRRIGGKEHKTVIYLPRVRYSRREYVSRQDLSDEYRRPVHQVSHHLRKSGTASAAQQRLAIKYGLSIPSGFTFVRPHQRGVEGEKQRIAVYRSRSASRMLFEELKTAPSGSRPAWFDFEKDCAQIIGKRGWEVFHQAASRDGDGGVDLFASDGDCDYVVQCKCWSHPVGPEVIRELHGAIAVSGCVGRRKYGGVPHWRRQIARAPKGPGTSEWVPG